MRLDGQTRLKCVYVPGLGLKGGCCRNQTDWFLLKLVRVETLTCALVRFLLLHLQYLNFCSKCCAVQQWPWDSRSILPLPSGAILVQGQSHRPLSLCLSTWCSCSPVSLGPFDAPLTYVRFVIPLFIYEWCVAQWKPCMNDIRWFLGVSGLILYLSLTGRQWAWIYWEWSGIIWFKDLPLAITML